MIPLEDVPPVLSPSVDAPSVSPAADDETPLLAYFQRLVEVLRTRRAESGNVLQVIGVTSCGPGEGVSTVAMNLATVAAQLLEVQVVLLDAHALRPSLDRTMGISRSPGLGDYLSGTTSLSDCLCGTWLEHLTVLPVGAEHTHGPGPQGLSRLRALFSELRRDFEFVVVDLPPLTEPGGWLSMAGDLDGVLLIVSADRINGPETRRAADWLRRAGVHLLGAVLNGCEQHAQPWPEPRR
jgi:Mrp family chromosome partitioning ATPase